MGSKRISGIQQCTRRWIGCWKPVKRVLAVIQHRRWIEIQIQAFFLLGRDKLSGDRTEAGRWFADWSQRKPDQEIEIVRKRKRTAQYVTVDRVAGAWGEFERKERIPGVSLPDLALA